MDKSKIEKDIEKLSSGKIKSNLIKASIYLSAFELLKQAVIEQLRDFYCDSFNDKGDIKESAKYKDKIVNRKIPELNNNKNVYYSSCLWLKEADIITSEDLDVLQDIRLHRNKIGHELPLLMVDSAHEINFELFDSIKLLLKKIDQWWIKEVEIPLNETFDDVKPEDIDFDGAFSGRMLLLEHMIAIVKEEL